jgi:hypothetical protein
MAHIMLAGIAMAAHNSNGNQGIPVHSSACVCFRDMAQEKK